MSVPTPAVPDPKTPRPTEPQTPAAPRAESEMFLPGAFSSRTSGWAEGAWKNALPLIPQPVHALIYDKLLKSSHIDRVPPWLDRLWTQRSSRLDIRPSLGRLEPLFPPLPLKEWANHYQAHLCQTEWESAPADPRQDWRALAVLEPTKEHPVTSAEPQHPVLPIPPGPQVWLLWTTPVRTAQPEPILVLMATQDAPRRGEILRVWHKETAWERTLTVAEDCLHLEDPNDPDHLGLVQLLTHQSRVFQECPLDGQ